LATIDVIQQECLLDNATARGQQLVTALRNFQQQSDVYRNMIRDVRGLGLMVATELDTKQHAKALQQACLERNLLILTCGTRKNILRWIPPLIVTESQMQQALDIFEEALQQVVQQDESLSSS